MLKRKKIISKVFPEKEKIYLLSVINKDNLYATYEHKRINFKKI